MYLVEFSKDGFMETMDYLNRLLCGDESLTNIEHELIGFDEGGPHDCSCFWDTGSKTSSVLSHRE